MPTYHHYSRKLVYAGETELLDFANRARKAGGANALEALLPSTVGSTAACLIANALNFGCSVLPSGPAYKDGSSRWFMLTPDNDTARKLAAAGCGRLRWVDDDYEPVSQPPRLTPYPDSWGVTREPDRLAVQLPKRIGNAAEVFDLGGDFQKYAVA